MAVPSNQHLTRLAGATYALRVTDNGAEQSILTLALPPQSIRPSQPSRIGFMETRTGVVVDEQGASPPTWDLSGQFRLGGGNGGDHYAQQRAIEAFIRTYLEANRERALARRTLLSLEWHDFYAGEHWIVAPLGVPLGERDSARPLVERWSLRLRGLTRTTATNRGADSVVGQLLADPNDAVAAVCPVDGFAV
jgi:hypothetical protein